MQIKEFLNEAKGLSKNPLGIIALFISLIYGFACLVLGLAANGLNDSQRWPLVWFLVIFPVLILIAFIYLVVNHHKKLYGPSDYKDESNFLSTLDEKEQTKRLNEEVATLIEENEGNSEGAKKGTDHIDLEEKQIQGQENHHKNEIEQIHKNTSDYKSKVTLLRESYLIAEDLALRNLEIELGTKILRQVAYNNSANNSVVEFDGIAVVKNRIIGIEVKYIKSQLISRHIIKSLSNTIKNFEGYSLRPLRNAIFHSYLISPRLINDMKFEILVVIVHEGAQVKTLQEQVFDIVNNSSVDLKFRFYDINDLKQRFGLKGGSLDNCV